MDRVIAAQVYLRICELGSLSAAARALGMSRPMVSRYLEQMESWAGARLIHRSTRRLTLTPAGEKVLLKTRGLTRIADEIAGERIDVAIRITDNPEAGAIARRLGVCRSLLCAAPGWMRQHGPLTTPDDLQRHNCLLYSHFASQHWQFSDAQGREASVAVNGNLSAGISSLLLEAAVAGCGIAMLPELEARGAIASGTLEVVLPEWTPKALSVYGIYLSRDYQPDGLPLFLDALQRRLGEETGHG